METELNRTNLEAWQKGANDLAMFALTESDACLHPVANAALAASLLAACFHALTWVWRPFMAAPWAAAGIFLIGHLK